MIPQMLVFQSLWNEPYGTSMDNNTTY